MKKIEALCLSCSLMQHAAVCYHDSIVNVTYYTQFVSMSIQLASTEEESKGMLELLHVNDFMATRVSMALHPVLKEWYCYLDWTIQD